MQTKFLIFFLLFSIFYSTLHFLPFCLPTYMFLLACRPPYSLSLSPSILPSLHSAFLHQPLPVPWFLIPSLPLPPFMGTRQHLTHISQEMFLCLQAATSLSKRPFFHNSSLIPIIYLLLRGLQQWLPGLPASMAWMFLLAWTSHHVRDGIRHGLWFAPFGSTPAVPKWLYISVISLCPLLLRAVLLLGRSNNVQGRNSSTTDHHETASLMTV